MKLRSLLLPAVIAVTIAPILSISLPARSQQSSSQSFPQHEQRDAGTIFCEQNPGVVGCNLHPTNPNPNPLIPNPNPNPKPKPKPKINVNNVPAIDPTKVRVNQQQKR